MRVCVCIRVMYIENTHTNKYCGFDIGSSKAFAYGLNQNLMFFSPSRYILRVTVIFPIHVDR